MVELCIPDSLNEPLRMDLRLRTLMAIGSTVTVSATLFASIPAHASAELDQSAPLPDPATAFIGLSPTTPLAQSFTAGISGHLTKVGLGGKQQGSLTNLTVSISDVAGDLPTGSSLSSTTLTGAALSIVPTGQQMFDIDLNSPVQVQQGSKYSIVLTTTDSSGASFYWYHTDYAFGAGSENINGGGWSLVPGTPSDFAFRTYVALIPVEPPSTTANPQAPPVQLSLQLTAGTICAAPQAAAQGPWVSLPSAGDCTPPATRPDANLLGWATSPDFPVAIAQRQVDNGWGAYETFRDDGQLTAVFIPAGGSTLMTNDTNLYPIWSE